MRIAAVVTALNEAPRIPAVLEVLCTYPQFEEVIVVDDGSTDATAAVAAGFDAKVISFEKNLGKGRAMEAGVQASSAEVIFFCDADIRGLTHEMISSILTPVIFGDVDMLIAEYDRVFVYMHELLPHLSGVRAVRRTLWDRVPTRFKERFMIETALNYHALHGGGYYYFIFKGLGHMTKEVKYGLFRGFIANLKMVWDIAYAQLLLRR